MAVNYYGLGRDIPEPVKLQVRQRCGFGCVVCGNPFIQYEHFDPEYKDAKDHLAEGITLLCGSCHDQTTKGLMSKEMVAYCNLNPYAISKGFAHGRLKIGLNNPIVL